MSLSLTQNRLFGRKLTRTRRQALREAVRRKLFLERLEDRRLLAALEESLARGFGADPAEQAERAV
jgi:hypothetical protein